MADVKIIDIDGEEWNVKDQTARDKIATLENETSKNFEYSTQEQVIGKWVNGENLYRLTVTGNTTTRSATINLADKNIKTVTKLNGVCIANNQYCFPIAYYVPNPGGVADNYLSYVNYDVQNKVLNLSFGHEGYFNNTSFNFVIEYTKNS